MTKIERFIYLNPFSLKMKPQIDYVDRIRRLAPENAVALANRYLKTLSPDELATIGRLEVGALNHRGVCEELGVKKYSHPSGVDTSRVRLYALVQLGERIPGVTLV